MIISRRKLVDYLLSTTHPVGKFKARIFQEWGFYETNVDVLENSLKTIARTQEVNKTTTSSYGTKYIVTGRIKTPTGSTITLQTVWILEPVQENPRFVTAYPV